MRIIQEQMQEITRRKAYYAARREARRLTQWMTGLGALLLIALLFALEIKGPARQPAASTLGATILGPEAGGYVIVALLAFALGIVATLATQKRRKMNQSRTGAEGKEQTK